MHIAFVGIIAQSCSTEHAETIAVREGLKLAAHFGYSGFNIGSECKGVINQLQSRSEALSSLDTSLERFLPSMIDS